MSDNTQNEQVTPDVILKDFWRNNDRFADLFNAVLFDGEQIIKPEDLKEADTDLSSVITLKKHTATLKRFLDVVKKTAYGVDFIIWSLENQQRVHYAMPLRHMTGDVLCYLKEYQELKSWNRAEKDLPTDEEFLSGMKKGDRLHPVVSICVYYGEEPWDGPLKLKDMLVIPEELKPFVSDYRMNLIQVLDSEKYHFRTGDVNTVFDITRNIYRKNYRQIEEVYRERTISSELGLTIGAITESQKLIKHALDYKGGELKMCKALQELEDKGRQEGDIKGTIETCQDFNATPEATMQKIKEKFTLNEEEAENYMKQYWKN